MRIVRYLVVGAPTLLALLVVSQIGAAQISSSHVEAARVAGPQAVWPPFTRAVTVTIDAGPESALALSSYWQTSVTDFSTAGGWDHWSVTLPSDATDITATVTGGTYLTSTNTITFNLTDPVCDFAWSYRTSQRVLRQGNQYQVDQFASTNQDRPFVYVGTVYFTAPYEYVGQIGPAPVLTSTSSVHWESSVPLNAPPESHKFSSSMWLADPRLAQPNLKIIDGTAYAQPGSSQVHVTAKIQNGSTITTGAPVYINIYHRRTPSSSPSDPLDLAGGWCSENLLNQPDCPSFDSTLGYTNVLKTMGPLQTVALTANLVLTQSGRWDIWIQVDVFGGPKGLNLESDESTLSNNRNLGSVSVYLANLPLFVKE